MVKFTEKGISIDGKEEPFYSGTFHYWRSHTKDWKNILENIKKMGFKIIETYIPWGVHEPKKGCFDFGEINKENNIEEFLILCEQMDLQVIVRPGPHINAEMDNFGFPDWVVKDREMTAKNPWGTEVVYPYITRPYAIPSYTSEKFYENVHAYYRQLSPILKRHAYPKGNIVAIQADNETCNFFRDNPYIMDYSKDSIKQYKAFLKNRYPQITSLNRKLHTAYRSHDDVTAPSGLNDTNYLECREWILFKEYQIIFAIKKIVSFIQEMDLNIPIFHNCAYQTYTPISVQKDEQIPGLSVAGMDAYPDPYDSEMLKERIRFLSGSSKLNFVPEFGAGSYFDRGIVLSARQEEFGYLYSFMNGMKAVNYYMLVERDRWTGCPLKNNGSIRKSYFNLYKTLNQFLIENEIWKDRREVKVLILKNYEMGRMKALSYECGLSQLSSNNLVVGPDVPQKILKHALPEDFAVDTCGDIRFEMWTNMAADFLDTRHITYDYSDMFISPGKMAQYDMVFAAAYPYMSEEYQELLYEYSTMAGKKLLIGPCVPDKNEYGEPWKKLQDAECICIESELQSIDLGKVQQPVDSREPGIEIAVHDCQTDEKQHVYIANTQMEQKAFTFTIPLNTKIREIWGKGYEKTVENTVYATMEPFSVSVYELTKNM